MPRKKIELTSTRFARAVRSSNNRKQDYILKLYVTGATARSARAIKNLKKICDDHLHGRYHLKVIDVYQQPELAKGEQIVAAPTLIKQLPKPLRRFIGDMSRTEHILLGLDLRSNPTNDETENDHQASNGTSRF